MYLSLYLIFLKEKCGLLGPCMGSRDLRENRNLKMDKVGSKGQSLLYRLGEKATHLKHKETQITPGVI